MSKELNTKNVELDEIYALKREGKRVIIGDKVRAIRVNTPNGGHDFFYRKEGTFVAEHAEELSVGEYSKVQIAFPEYTAELQQEHTELIELIAESVDDEITALEEEYDV